MVNGAEKFVGKDKYTFDDLVEIMQILRRPDGCPWDREQTHKTIRQNFIEETYEVVEAIDNNDKALLCEVKLLTITIKLYFAKNLAMFLCRWFFIR